LTDWVVNLLYLQYISFLIFQSTNNLLTDLSLQQQVRSFKQYSYLEIWLSLWCWTCI